MEKDTRESFSQNVLIDLMYVKTLMAGFHSKRRETERKKNLKKFLGGRNLNPRHENNSLELLNIKT